MRSRRNPAPLPARLSGMTRLRTGYGSGVRLRLVIFPWQISSGSATIPSLQPLQHWMHDAPIITDIRMVQVGIQKKGHASEVICALDYGAEIAKEQEITRSSAGFLALRKRLPGSIVVIGNAPSALISLCGMIKEGSGRRSLSEPRLVLSMQPSPRNSSGPLISPPSQRKEPAGEHRLQLRPSTNASPSLSKASAMKDPITGFEYPDDWVAKCTSPETAPAGGTGSWRAHVIRPCPPPRVYDRDNCAAAAKAAVLSLKMDVDDRFCYPALRYSR